LVPILMFAALALPLLAGPNAKKVVEGAKRQVGVTRYYESQYRQLAYPGGDLPPDRGVCTDVVIRAYRNAGIDLQVLVHEDMKAHFDAYPKGWGLRRPDTNIDHRRVPNLSTFFRRHGAALPVTRRAADYQPGDIVTYDLPDGWFSKTHIGIVAAEKTLLGVPLLIHNRGWGVQAEDWLFAARITGHYRYAGPR
jgi:uncharacterized protein YijF (DUF1287 family)